MACDIPPFPRLTLRAHCCSVRTFDAHRYDNLLILRTFAASNNDDESHAWQTGIATIRPGNENRAKLGARSPRQRAWRTSRQRTGVPTVFRAVKPHHKRARSQALV